MANQNSHIPLPPGQGLSDDKSYGLLNLIIIMTILPLIAILVRLWARALTPGERFGHATGSSLWWDDYLIVLSWITMTVMNGLGCRLIALGLGRHAAAVQLSMSETSEFLGLLFANEVLFHLGLTLAKSAAVLFLHRIFDVSGSKYYWSLRITHLSVWLWLITSWLTTVFECSPVEKYWKPWLPGKCLNQEAIWEGITVPNLIIDFIILILPIPKLWKLQMSARRKVLISGVFILGYGVIITTIAENVLLVKAGPTLSDDLTWNSVDFISWLVTSIPIAIITVCLPPSVALVKRAKEHGLYSLLRTNLPSAAPAWDIENGKQNNISINSPTRRSMLVSAERDLKPNDLTRVQYAAASVLSFQHRGAGCTVADTSETRQADM